jgi:hypothetical protein
VESTNSNSNCDVECVRREVHACTYVHYIFNMYSIGTAHTCAAGGGDSLGCAHLGGGSVQGVRKQRFQGVLDAAPIVPSSNFVTRTRATQENFSQNAAPAHGEKNGLAPAVALALALALLAAAQVHDAPVQLGCEGGTARPDLRRLRPCKRNGHGPQDPPPDSSARRGHITATDIIRHRARHR